VVYAGADPLTNKPRYIRETHKTHAAAQVSLTKLQGQVDEERHPRTDITMRQAVANGWKSSTWPTRPASGTTT